MLLLAWRLHALAGSRAPRWARRCAAVALWQLLSGLSNVVLGWPLVAALAHTGGCGGADHAAGCLRRASCTRLAPSRAGDPLRVPDRAML